MTYDQPDEMFRFVWRNESFRLSRFWPRPRPQRNGRMLDGRWNWQVWGSSCTKALEAGGLSSVPTSSGLAFEPALRGVPRREKLAQKSTQVVEITGGRKLVREVGKASFKSSDRRRSG